MAASWHNCACSPIATKPDNMRLRFSMPATIVAGTYVLLAGGLAMAEAFETIKGTRR